MKTEGLSIFEAYRALEEGKIVADTTGEYQYRRDGDELQIKSNDDNFTGDWEYCIPDSYPCAEEAPFKIIQPEPKRLSAAQACKAPAVKVHFDPEYNTAVSEFTFLSPYSWQEIMLFHFVEAKGWTIEVVE